LVELLVEVVVSFLVFLEDLVDFRKMRDKGSKVVVSGIVVDFTGPIKKAPCKVEVGVD
jgi:hypothetical protein